MFEYHDGIENLAGATPIREKMVKDALEYLDNLSAESESDAGDLQRELAAAYQKVGDVQGSPYRANLGNSKGALESYKKALAIREKLHSDAKKNAQLKLDLMQSYSAVGELSQVTGNLPEALENYRKAFAVYDTLSETNESKRALAVLFRQNARALVLNGKLAEEEPTNSLHRGNYAIALTRVSEMSLKFGSKTEALEGFQKALAIREELVAANPEYAVGRGQLAFIYKGLGDCFASSAAEENEKPRRRLAAG